MNRCYKPTLPKNCDYSVRNWTNLDNSVSAHLIQTPIAVLGIRDILVRIRIRIPNTAQLQWHHQYLSYVNNPYRTFSLHFSSFPAWGYQWYCRWPPTTRTSCCRHSSAAVAPAAAAAVVAGVPGGRGEDPPPPPGWTRAESEPFPGAGKTTSHLILRGKFKIGNDAATSYTGRWGQICTVHIIFICCTV